MRVLIIRNSFDYDFGGAERLAVFLAEQLVLNGIEPIVASHHKMVLSFAQSRNIRNHQSPWWSKQNWSGVNILLTPLFLGWQLVLFCWYILFIKRNNIDALHLMSRDDFIAGTLAG